MTFEKWYQELVINHDNIRESFRECWIASKLEETVPSASTNTGSPKCPHYQPLADCVWQGDGSNNGITCSDSGPCVWTLRAGA